MATSFRPILPKTVKPNTYMNDPLIKAAIDVLDASHHEFEVGRAVVSILRKYFPQQENWTIVPEFLVPERKKPDYCIEQYTPDRSPTFRPKIFVEIKSGTGAHMEKALDQITSSMVLTTDKLGGDFACFLIVVRGKQIGFFEYHNDRSNLTEDGFLQYSGAVPFNRPQENTPADRPNYRGTGMLGYKDEWGSDLLGDMEGVYLDIDREDVTIDRVLNWMKNKDPAKGPADKFCL